MDDVGLRLLRWVRGKRRNFLYLCGMGTDFQQRLARIRGRVVEVVRENVSLKTENLALAQELEELKKTIALQKKCPCGTKR